MSRDPIDQHNFFIWRYADDSVDISCERPEVDLDPKTAYLEASVLARTLAEELHGHQEIFSARVFEDGMVACQFREQPGFVSGWKQFRWVRARLSEASHNGILAVPKAPGAIQVTLWAVEYFFCKVRGFFTEDSIEEVEIPEAPPEYPENVIPLRKLKSS